MTERDRNPQGYIRILELVDQGFSASDVSRRLRKPLKEVRRAIDERAAKLLAALGEGLALSDQTNKKATEITCGLHPHISWPVAMECALKRIERLQTALKQIVDEAESDDGLTAWDGSEIAKAALEQSKGDSNG